MFNFFNAAKDQNNQETKPNEAKSSSTENELEQANDKDQKAPVHGEDNVCCGGCGGQQK